ncbi:hypothetical protein AAMO2058_000325000 [Amorphochlora amoebiformis]
MSDDPTESFCVANVKFEDVEAAEEGRKIGLQGGSEELKAMVANDGEDGYAIPNMKIHAEREKFPYSIVWGPLPCITWCLPCVGHMGIGDSKGRIHDFAGPYTVNTDRFMTGRVTRYYQFPEDSLLALRSKGEPSRVWDVSILEGDRKYTGLMHNICCQNCHHHTADCARNAGIKINWFEAAVLLFCRGKFVSFDRTLIAFGPFFLLIVIFAIFLIFL